MRNADVPALLWAVRRQLDLLLEVPDSLSGTQKLADLVEVTLLPPLRSSLVSPDCTCMGMPRNATAHGWRSVLFVFESYLAFSLQVADVGGVDGFAHLLDKLLAQHLAPAADSGTAAASDSREQQPIQAAIQHVLETCLRHSHLVAAAAEGFVRTQQHSKHSAPDLTAAVTSLAKDSQVTLCLALLRSQPSDLREAGTSHNRAVW